MNAEVNALVARALAERPALAADLADLDAQIAEAEAARAEAQVDAKRPAPQTFDRAALRAHLLDVGTAELAAAQASRLLADLKARRAAVVAELGPTLLQLWRAEAEDRRAAVAELDRQVQAVKLARAQAETASGSWARVRDQLADLGYLR